MEYDIIENIAIFLIGEPQPTFSLPMRPKAINYVIR